MRPFDAPSATNPVPWMHALVRCLALPMLAIRTILSLFVPVRTVLRTCVKRAAFPRCISVHFRVSFADVDPVCFSPGLKGPPVQQPYLHMFPPLTHVASVSLELIRKPFLYSPLLSSPISFPILSYASPWRAFGACGALLVVAYLRLVGYSEFLTHWPLLCAA